MALPLAPLAIVAFRYGAVALVAYAVTRLVPKLRYDQSQDDILDSIEDGLEARRDAKQVNITGRWRRTVRILQSGPGIEIDATMFSRLKVKKVD
jgi:LDH2 family malate/lactate/ureidoglycolate dehydrogenase